MGAEVFDYYIFIDYSENLIGYTIIEKEKIKDLLPKISKIKHYKEVNKKSQYLKAIKKMFDKYNITNYFSLYKIKKVMQTLEIFADIADFIVSHKDSLIFISLDEHQSSNFERLVKDIDGNKVLVINEGKLRKDTIEHRLSLIIDNLLNLERVKNEMQS